MPSKTIGVIGGITFHSTVPYYTKINQNIQNKLGFPHSASILLHSFDLSQIFVPLSESNWDVLTAKFIDASVNLRNSGAQALVLACNSGHGVADRLEEAINIPLLHIADGPAQLIKAKGLKRIGLLGARPVMELPFIKERLQARGNLDEILVPASERDWDRLDQIISKELAAGLVKDDTKEWMLQTAKELVDRGAEAIVLACTDFQFLLTQEDMGNVLLIDTLEEHARYIAEWATSD